METGCEGSYLPDSMEETKPDRDLGQVCGPKAEALPMRFRDSQPSSVAWTLTRLLGGAPGRDGPSAAETALGSGRRQQRALPVHEPRAGGARRARLGKEPSGRAGAGAGTGCGDRGQSESFTSLGREAG